MGGMEPGADVRQSLKDGDLAKALEQAKTLVRKDPASAKPRILLFQLFAICGDWDRSLNQLAVAGDMTAETALMVGTYREALPCEPLRARIFAGRETPIVLGKPENWIALLIEALRLDGLGKTEEAAALRVKALDEAPATAGTIDGTSFSWIADGDQRLGPVLEAVVKDRYCWIPLHRIRSIDVEPPTDLRDLVWTAVTLTLANGGEIVALVPTRYPGSAESADPLLRLARRTDWVETPGGLYTGLGQRMLATDAGEHALMDVRRIDLAVDLAIDLPIDRAIGSDATGPMAAEDGGDAMADMPEDHHG